LSPARNETVPRQPAPPDVHAPSPVRPSVDLRAVHGGAGSSGARQQPPAAASAEALPKAGDRAGGAPRSADADAAVAAGGLNPHLAPRLKLTTAKLLSAVRRADAAQRSAALPAGWEASARRRSCSSAPCPQGMLCVDAVCKCPVMYSGSANCTAHTQPPVAWCLAPSTAAAALAVMKQRDRTADLQLLEAPPDLSQLPGVRWGTCAVVGQSDRLTDQLLGGAIDEADAIIRVGDAPTLGYEQFVGSRTTVRVQRRERCGFAERPGELCLLYDSLSADGSSGRKACGPPRRGRPGCRVMAASRRMIWYGKLYWQAVRPPHVAADSGGGTGARSLSPEFYAVALAMHLCGQVNIYGLSLAGGEMVYWKGGRDVDMSRHWQAAEQRCHAVLRSDAMPRTAVVV